jgi:hypothetical protein
VNHTIGFLIESTVVVLLVIMIGYCFVLERRLRRLRSDEHSLRAIIGELITATDRAERAIAGLKVTVRESDQTLGERLRAAERFRHDIDRQLAAGGTALRRVTEVAPTSPPSQAMPTSNTRSTLAAAQAFAERARNRRGDVAA